MTDAWLSEGPVVLDPSRRALLSRHGSELATRLAASGITIVAVCWVDNAGLTRVKAIPVSRLERAAAWGIGASPAFDVLAVDDSITTSAYVGGPGGDLRLVPDLGRVRALAGQPGWALAPADRYTQDGRVYSGCQRGFAQRLAGEAARQGLTAQLSFELEWCVGSQQDGRFVPAGDGPAYGMTRVIELSDYARELVEAIDREGIAVEQFHPEYAPGQFELSVSPNDPVGAADDTVLVRQTIRAVSARHGLQASFAPKVAADGMGNGGHLHLSLWRDGHNLFTGGDGRYGLTADGEAFAAGILSALPALIAIGAPSVASYLRLVPSHWAGAYQCWGWENREAALRLVTGSAGEQSVRANLEVKSFDLAANPYLVAGSVLAAGLTGISLSSALPEEIAGDPAELPPGELAERSIARLPQSLDEAVKALEGSDLLRSAMGGPLFEAFVAVRRAEIDLFANATAEDIVSRTRWRW